MDYLHIVHKRCKRKAQERTVMVLVLNYQSIGMQLVAVNRIMVPGKQVNKFFRRTSKQKQHCQPCRKDDMYDSRQQLILHSDFAKIGLMILRFTTLLLICFICHTPAPAQRLKDPNTIGWYSTFNTIHISNRTSLWIEYQWRRENFIKDWQQSLARTGIQYHFKNGLSALLGYGYIITYPYGDYPAGQYTIPEHRIFEQLIWNDAISRVGLNHRMRLEQRFVGKVNQAATVYDVSDWTYMNRFRYQLRATIPINKKTMVDKTWYAATFDEIFIGFGKNVNQNIFDQNRIGLLAGYQFNKTFRLEGGYFNQIVQQGALVANREVFQYNRGLMLNAYLTLNN